ncbi:AAA family ATPase [Candidatus Riflebacteria bacterium]
MSKDIRAIEEEVQSLSGFVPKLREEIQKVIIGQDYMVERLLLGLLADGHVLLEGVPGLAKTTAVKTLSETMNLDFSRISFTPDLLPSDLVGTQIYSPKDGTFSTKKGPVFTNILLADEINRAPAKVQSALLECMQERQVTIGEHTFSLQNPFLVLATQNPLEQAGTYPLPEAQLDRFMLKLKVGYPSKSEERSIIDLMTGTPGKVEGVVTLEDILKARAVVSEIHVQDKLKDYIVDLVFCTRDPLAYGLNALVDKIEFGASPRASIYLAKAAQAYAFLKGRGFVSPQDIKNIAPDILRHRLIVTYEAEAEEISSDEILQDILDKIEVP